MRFLIERLEVQIPDHGQTFCHILVDIFILDETGNMWKKWASEDQFLRSGKKIAAEWSSHSTLNIGTLYPGLWVKYIFDDWLKVLSCKHFKLYIVLHSRTCPSNSDLTISLSKLSLNCENKIENKRNFAEVGQTCWRKWTKENWLYSPLTVMAATKTKIQFKWPKSWVRCSKIYSSTHDRKGAEEVIIYLVSQALGDIWRH